MASRFRPRRDLQKKVVLYAASTKTPTVTDLETGEYGNVVNGNRHIHVRILFVISPSPLRFVDKDGSN